MGLWDLSSHLENFKPFSRHNYATILNNRYITNVRIHFCLAVIYIITENTLSVATRLRLKIMVMDRS